MSLDGSFGIPVLALPKLWSLPGPEVSLPCRNCSSNEGRRAGASISSTQVRAIRPSRDSGPERGEWVGVVTSAKRRLPNTNTSRPPISAETPISVLTVMVPDRPPGRPSTGRRPTDRHPTARRRFPYPTGDHRPPPRPTPPMIAKWVMRNVILRPICRINPYPVRDHDPQRDPQRPMVASSVANPTLNQPQTLTHRSTARPPAQSLPRSPTPPAIARLPVGPPRPYRRFGLPRTSEPPGPWRPTHTDSCAGAASALL
jgi:hypothetical protein